MYIKRWNRQNKLQSLSSQFLSKQMNRTKLLRKILNWHGLGFGVNSGFGFDLVENSVVFLLFCFSKVAYGHEQVFKVIWLPNRYYFLKSSLKISLISRKQRKLFCRHWEILGLLFDHASSHVLIDKWLLTWCFLFGARLKSLLSKIDYYFGKPMPVQTSDLRPSLTSHVSL